MMFHYFGALLQIQSRTFFCKFEPLSMDFPSSYALAASKEAWVADIWDDLGEGGHWNPCFIKHLNDWELDNVEDFLSIHEGKSVKREVKDSVVWMDSRNEVFSIKSFYSILRSRHAILSPMAIIWNSWLPSKACFFFFFFFCMVS